MRLNNYNYGSRGAYFITVCTFEKMCLFGEIKNGGMILNELGEIANKIWMKIPKHFTHVYLDKYIIMPNHMHGIIVINKTVGATHWGAPTSNRFGIK